MPIQRCVFKKTNLLIVALLLALSVCVAAQVTTADVVGRVTDSSGAVLPGVTIVIENLGTGATRSSVSSDTGDYVFNLLPSGRYSVRFELHFKAVRKKFEDAGIALFAYTVNFRNDFTDDELEKSFEQAKALGISIIAASTQLSVAKRLVPFAERHKVYVAMHGHSNVHDTDEFSGPESFSKALGMSKYFRINLDIGHFTAANFDAVTYIRDNHDNITHLHLKDRKKNDGPNMPWGEGETPIRQVLLLLKEKKYPIRAFVEYEYRGTGTPIDEVKKCMSYMRRALA